MAQANKRLTKRQRRQSDREAEMVYDRSFHMKTIRPVTATQGELFDAYNEGQNIAAIGSAGTGKTYASTYLALKDVLENQSYEKVLFVRSAVQSRDQGFMPGSLKDKEAYFETPFVDIVNDLFGSPQAYASLKQRGKVAFCSTSFIRGLTFDNTVIIVDEAQNANAQELHTIATRVGNNSRIIFCGDTRQDDLERTKNRVDNSGLSEFMRVLDRMQSVTTVKFTAQDIVRSGFVKEFILAQEALGL